MIFNLLYVGNCITVILILIKWCVQKRFLPWLAKTVLLSLQILKTIVCEIVIIGLLCPAPALPLSTILSMPTRLGGILLSSLWVRNHKLWMRALYTPDNFYFKPIYINQKNFTLPRELRRGPEACETRCSRGSWLHHAIPSVTLKYYLSTIWNLPDIRPILIQSWVADQQHFAMIQESRKGTVNYNEVFILRGHKTE